MRACGLLLIAAMAVAASGCHKKQPPSQDVNIGIDEPATNQILANADIETLPPDESSETPSNELATGSDNPDVNDVSASSNSQ